MAAMLVAVTTWYMKRRGRRCLRLCTAALRTTELNPSETSYLPALQTACGAPQNLP
jgi:hypothetical protein